jgi:hypothetical protein
VYVFLDLFNDCRFVCLFVCLFVYFNASRHLCVDVGNGFDILLVMYGELVT